MNVTIRITGLPKMANGGHGSKFAAAGRTKKWKGLVARELAGLAPSRPWQKVHVTFIRRSSVEPDYDGLVHGFKALRDAVVKFGFVIDDRNSCMESLYLWEKVKAGQGHVELVIRGITP